MVTIECPQCHHKNPDDAEFCEQCGAELPVAAHVASSSVATQVANYGGQAQSPSSADDLVCPKCKAPYVPGDVFCFNCGNDLRGLPGNKPAAAASAPAAVQPVNANSNGGAVANSNATVPAAATPPAANNGMSEDDWDKAFTQPTGSTANPTPPVVNASTATADPVTPPVTVVSPSTFSNAPTNGNAFAEPVTPPAATTVNPVQTGAGTAPSSHLTLNVNGPYGIQTVEFVGRELLLGRTDAKTRVFPDVNLDDAAASRRHASVWLEDQEGQFYVQDLESSNGTSLNGNDLEPGSPVKLTNNDILKIGTRYSIQIHIS